MQICLNTTPFYNANAQYPLACSAIAEQVYAFHKSLPNYAPTPLQSLPALAKQLQLKRLWVKDESHRFDLNAFKILGASYAVARILAQYLDLSATNIHYNDIVAQAAKYSHKTLVTATDGNHGRAVAWAAQKFGCKAQVYLPIGAAPERLAAIQAYGAAAEILPVEYDQAVAHAAAMAEKHDWTLVQDTSWPGYQDIPNWILQGYFTLLNESLEQIPSAEFPTHVFVQGGVGSLPAALLARFVMLENGLAKPTFVVVEPDAANCLFRSIEHGKGKSVSVEGHLDTIMAGLACGTPSQDALSTLRTSADAFMCCEDDVAKRGMRVLGNPMGSDPRIVSGESGAVTLGLIYELCHSEKYAAQREQIKLNTESKVLLFSTEGDTAPEIYRDIVWNP